MRHPSTFALVAAAVLAAATGSALAQGAIKPLEALVINSESRPVPVSDKLLLAAVKALSDGAGRVPYQHMIIFNQGPNTCTQFVCTTTFPAVPAGKRLVVTHASASFGVVLADSYPNVALSDSSANAPKLLLPAPVATGPGSVVASSPISFHVAAGLSPTLDLRAINISAASNSATATVVGYLVDVN
jgi:hypothetical protein